MVGVPESGSRPNVWSGCETVEWAARIIHLYGIGRFLADIDEGRCFWREDGAREWGGSVFHTSLDWAATAGFDKLTGHYAAGDDRVMFADAQEFRHRHLIRALKALLKK